ncbi:MAG: PDZ domain-containing protein [Chitinophagaceae bacterium]|nr:PDZ domain-containing protein [Chitinophagaceae bacterium]MCA6469150.1 PDZ domain-containing protein [Chitinophagaceae bacterium]MCA6476776.1 PDZ domain-containing protein [Chitinophagaceae bacterium]MCA6480439.1 PDZ domain-containing protein [Chitinophagaceae bacterium]MCA6491197.1 PDZ domain-containing protein [Chitinophagaceae bacterium]
MRLLVLTTLCMLGLTSSAQPPIPAQPPVPPLPPKGPSKIIVIRDGDTTITMMEPGQMRIKREMFRKEAPDEQLRQLGEGRMLYMMPNFEMPEENKALLGVATEKDEKGALIVDVNAGTPAEKCGLQKDDIITAINGYKISDPENLYKEVGKYLPEDKIKIDYLRNGEAKTTTAKLAPNFPVEGRMPERLQDLNLRLFGDGNNAWDLLNRMGGPKPNLGLTLTDTEKGRGVEVTSVKENTPAAKAGLQKTDLLLSINGKELKDVNDVKKLKSTLKEGDTWKLVYERYGKKMETDIKFPKKLMTAEL